jgi:hypothetical protein
MLTHGIRESQKAVIHLTVNELRQLMHWARAGLATYKGGTYWYETPHTIKELEKRLKDKKDRCLRLR